MLDTNSKRLEFCRKSNEILIFGTHLDIDAYCFSVKALVSEYYEE